MFKVLVCASALVASGLCTPVMALDLVDPSPPEASRPAGVSNWNGFYLGTSLAFGMGATEFEIDSILRWDSAGSKGASAGLLAGYNHQFGDWVGGVEFAGMFGGPQGHTELVLSGDEIQTRTLSDWSAGITARLGYLTSPDTLIFAGLGARLYNGAIQIDQNGTRVYDETDQFSGVGTITLGIETALNANWRVRAQYDADFLQANDYSGLTVTPLIGTAKASLLYAFDGNPDVAMTTPNAEAWAGFYAGIIGGQSMGVAALHLGDTGDHLDHTGFGSSGWTGGLVAGYNLNLSERVLVGFELGAYRSGQRTFIGSPVEEDGFQGTNDWWYDARLRLGYLPSDATMLYGFAGLNHTNSTVSLLDNGAPVGSTETLERNGVTLGAGIETRLTQNLFVRAEYAYTALEADDLVDGLPESGSLGQDNQTATIGLIYHFGS